MDNLYREPKDGMICLRKNFEYNNKIPPVELVTIIDLSTLWEDKQNLARKLADQLCMLNHRNLLNITRKLRYFDNHMHEGLL